MRRNAEAVQVLDEVARQPRHWAEARLLIASIRQGEGRADQARAIVDEVLSKEPGSRAAQLAGARLDVAARRLAPAQETLMRLVGENARDIQAQYLLGTVLAASGKLAEATRAFEAVLEINPRAAAAQTQLARLALLRGFPADAGQRAGEAVRNAPHDPRARLMLVRSQLAQRQLADAERELAGLVTAFPAAPPVQVELGRLRLMQRALPAARKAFEAAAKSDPLSLDVLSGLVAVDIAESKPVQARKRIDTRVAATPEDSATQGLAGRLLLTLGDSAQAERALRKAVELDPANLEAYGLLGRIYLGRGQPDEAIAEFEAIARRRDKPVAMRTMIGMIRQAQGDAAAARASYEQALKLDPQAAVAANNLAWLYAERGQQLDSALRLALSAKAIMRTSPAVDDTLGFVYLQRSAPEQAVTPLRDAVVADPGNPSYRYRLALALSRSGQVDESRRELRRALALRADFPEAEAARVLLKSLG